MQILSSSISGSTFVDIVSDRAQTAADRTAFVFLDDGETAESYLTFGELDQRARAIATHLSTKAAVGDRALILYPYTAGLDFIAAFLGCLYAGIVPAPTHPPRNRSGLDDVLGRLASSQARLMLTPKSMQTKLQRQLKQMEADLSTIRWLIPETVPSALACDWKRPNLRTDSLAFLQYTSGSTGHPKGVMISHGGLLHNQRLLQHAFGHTQQCIGMGWLPLFHDMGLIGNVLQPLYLGTPCVLMSPIAFVQKPVRWLQAVSRYRATTSGGPNFAYDLLCRHVTDAQRQQLDLSHWEVAFSGAEPVRAATLEQFVERFAPCGFRRQALYPCYGMAEATLFITGGQKSQPPRIGYVENAALENHRAAWADSDGVGRRSLVSCGHPWLDGQVAIAHPETGHRCQPDEIGEIWVSGAGLGQGYWNQPEESDRTFNAYLADSQEGPFLRTGDLGFLHDGELYITGRLNDVLVFWGLNHYPDAIERTVAACHPAFRANSSAAFAISVDGGDRLVIAQEIERTSRHTITAQDVIESVRWAVFDEHVVDVYGLVLLRPGGLPRTSSGKVQRRACRDRYLSGDLEMLDEWRSPAIAATDLSSLIRRYMNPTTHLRRWLRRYGMLPQI